MTFKEFMHTTNPNLEHLATKAELARDREDTSGDDPKLQTITKESKVMTKKTIKVLLKEADNRNEVQDLHNSRQLNPTEQEAIYPGPDETPAKPQYDKAFQLHPSAELTWNFFYRICNTAADYATFPVDMGFKLNNLNATEFRIYANRLLQWVHDNTPTPAQYEQPNGRDKAFYNFRDQNKTIMTTKPKTEYKAPAQDPHSLPTDRELLLKKQLDDRDAEIHHLKTRLNNAAIAYKELRDFAYYTTDAYLEAGQNTRKGCKVIVK